MMENYIREPDEKEPRKRKRTSFDPVVCPVCGITIRESELDQHYKIEMEKLGKIRKIVNKSPSSSTTPPSTSRGKTGESSSSSTSKTEADENCWETFQKIKENRVRRSSKVNNREH